MLAGEHHALDVIMNFQRYIYQHNLLVLSDLMNRLLPLSDVKIFGWQWEDTLNEKYPHVVYQEHCKACDAEQCDSTEDNGSDKIEGLHLYVYYCVCVCVCIVGRI